MKFMQMRPVTLTILSFAAVALSVSVFAQGERRFRDRPVFSFSGGQGPGIFLGGPGNMRGPAKFGMIDPAQRNSASLLLRNDVRTELVISAKQREEVEALDKGEGGRPRPLRFEFKNEGEGPGSPEEMRERIDKQIREAFASTIEERNKKAEAGLRPEQLRRLNELDVQWRGPLGLVDPVLAEKLELEANQVIKIRDLYKEYRAVQQRAMSEALKDFMEMQESSDNTDDGERRRIGVRIRIPDEKDLTPEQNARFEKRDKEIEEARKALGEKALALLTPTQKQKWQSLQGKRFTFRLVD